MVVPFAAGGAVDVLARTLAARAAEILGQQIVIENVGGAGGMTGASRVAKAAPDGYQFVLGSVGTHAQNQWLYKQPAYNALKDFEPVILVGSTPLLLVTRKDFPANNLQEFIAYAQSSSGRAASSARPASARRSIIGCVLFNAAAGINATHIPYRGGAPAMQDIIAGRIDYGCNIITSAYPQVRDQAGEGAGVARAPSARRSCPTLPPRRSRAWPDFDAGSWNVIFLPKGTPEPIVRKLNAAISEAMDSPGNRQAAARNRRRHPAARTGAAPPMPRASSTRRSRNTRRPIKASGIVIE